jgi:disulfide bond formation protein DsbB
MISVDTLNYILSLGTIIMQVVTVGLVGVLVFRRFSPDLGEVIEYLGGWGVWIGFALTLVGSVMTLYYSEVLGFIPCPLCWWQRIFLYPQVVLFAIALWKKDRSITLYSIILSVLGAVIALYQHALQVLPSGTLPCPATGTVSCAQRFVFEFNYVTFPMMSATLFACLIVVMLAVRSHRNA